MIGAYNSKLIITIYDRHNKDVDMKTDVSSSSSSYLYCPAIHTFFMLIDKQDDLYYTQFMSANKQESMNHSRSYNYSHHNHFGDKHALIYYARA
jgi:hypothetical protein